jgi:hypothetical protein
MDIAQVEALLPRQILDIAASVGMPTAMLLVEQLGGTSWEFAKGSNRNGLIRIAALADILGEEAASKLTRHLGGEKIYIPRCADALRRLRDLKIHRQFEEALLKGASANTAVAALAREFKLSDRWVWEILKQPLEQEEVPQGTLFH